MKKHLLFITLLLIFSNSYAQSDETVTPKEVKTGINVGLLPVVAFDSDLGFQYGGLSNIYFYGDGSQYPDYRHSLYLEVSRYVKGSGINRIFYDSKYLIPGLRFTSDVSYLTEQAYAFYGFNGAQAVYNPGWMDDEDPSYRSRMFYRHERNRFRLLADFQGKFFSDKLYWVAGFQLLNDEIASVNVAKLNEGKTEDLLPLQDSVPGLFELYQQWGIISPEEADGGLHNYLKLGLIYDTRDNEPHPMKGMWTELVLQSAPSFLGSETPYTLLNFTHRQYFTLLKDRLDFAYRLMSQNTIAGSAPFYLKPNVVTTMLRGANSEGLGGSKTLRGILLNRVVGDGFVLANAELRWKFVKFRFIKQNFYLGLNAFVDAGMVTQMVDISDDQMHTIDALLNAQGGDADDYFNSGDDKMHYSTGLGLRIAMNQNFIIAVDYGIALEKQDGEKGMYIGLNYIF
ncbi:MAG: BamA/TamA family outer membrane protein [Bacteroidales bacterium]|nr:BamA/TamA family outer membrane protein [Bacteroidales bacterium]